MKSSRRIIVVAAKQRNHEDCLRESEQRRDNEWGFGTDDQPQCTASLGPSFRLVARLLLAVGLGIAFAAALIRSSELRPVNIQRRTDLDALESRQKQENALTTTDTTLPEWQLAGHEIARVYPAWNGEDPFGWCVQDGMKKNASGLLFVKIYKCASSTGAGISLNIAHHVARRKNVSKCQASVGHHYTQRLPLPQRKSQESSFLWTLVRHPAKRTLSHYYFKKVSKNGELPSDEAMLTFMEKQKNFELSSLQEHSLHNFTLKGIMQGLDFVGIVERMDESLVVLQLLLGLQPSDVIVLSSKRAGGYDAKEECHKIVPPGNISATVQDYLDTSFQEDNRDYELYAAANASLDKTIDALGRERVEREVIHHRYLQQMAEKKCLETAKFPCSPEGLYQGELSKESCYDKDWGCGWKCVEEALESLGN